jgi:hypothetical protein
VIYDNRKEKLDQFAESHEEGQHSHRTSQERGDDAEGKSAKVEEDE